MYGSACKAMGVPETGGMATLVDRDIQRDFQKVALAHRPPPSSVSEPTDQILVGASKNPLNLAFPGSSRLFIHAYL